MVKGRILLTVIVTVYNVEAYIRQCVESIINQTYKNLEIIIIDDGSSDKSGDICDEYAGQDERIQVIHKSNAGLAAARQQGVEMAGGVVAAFVDGDDWIEPDMYEHMMKIYEEKNLDLVTSGMLWEWENRQSESLDCVPEGIYEKEAIKTDILHRMMYDMEAGKQGITASVCNKLFDRVLLWKVMETVDQDLTLGEDGAVTYYFLAVADKVCVTGRSWYHYRQRPNSMRITYGSDALEKIHRMEKCLLDNFRRAGFGSELNEQVYAYVRGFLKGAVREKYGAEMDRITHIFPYEKVPPAQRIILYGAGNVGKSFWKCLRYGEYAEIAAWTDKNHMKLRKCGMPVESVRDALQKEYDFIVIAVESGKTAEEIQEELFAHGVSREKMIWTERKRVE